MRTGPAAKASKAVWMIWCGVFVLGALPFLPALANEFVAWDDDVNFLDNPHYRGLSPAHLRWMFTSFHVGHYMPLTWLSAAVDHAFWGMNPAGYHLTNLLLHGAAAVLFGRVVLRLLSCGRRPPGGAATATHTTLAAAAGALFFALHPLRVESVAWATERRDVLSGVFTMLTVLAWLRSRPVPDEPHGESAGESPGESPGRNRRWYALALAAYAAALLSKTSGMTLPLVLLILDGVPLGRLRSRADLWPALADKLPFLVLGAGGALLAYMGQAHNTQLLATLETAPLSQRAALAAYGLAFYPWKTIWPLDLAPLYELELDFDPLAPRYVVAALAVAGITLALWCARHRRAGRAALAAWSAYIVLVAPLSGLVQSGWHRAADRYSYLATLPLAVLFAAQVQRSGTRGLAGAAIVLATLGALTTAQTRHWRDTETLFRRVVEVDPGSYLGLRKLGIALHEQGRYDEAIEVYERALLQRPEDNADTLASLALSAHDRAAPGFLTQSFGALERALDQAPTQPLALRLYVDLARRAGRVVPAEQRLRAALAEDAGCIPAYLGLARIASQRGDHEGALELCDEALAADPAAVEALNLAGVELVYLERFPEAEARLRAALELRPGDATAHLNLGVVRERSGDPAGARELWERALELSPGNPAALQLLAGSGNE